VISINTDWFYTANKYNYINMTEPDSSGTLKWLADELQVSENNGQRVWIIGHIPIGYTGGASLKNPSELFGQILERYSPHVIAGTFWGHWHDEFAFNSYTNNGTVKDASTALMLNWVGPSLTPLSNLNSGFRMYEVDSGNFNVMGMFLFILSF
jgi:sphingomyelin phosphodiesterase